MRTIVTRFLLVLSLSLAGCAAPEEPASCSVSRADAIGHARNAPRFAFGGIIFLSLFCLAIRRRWQE